MEGSPRMVKKKIITFLDKMYLLDCHCFFPHSFKTNVSEDPSPLLRGFKGSLMETNKMLPSSLLH